MDLNCSFRPTFSIYLRALQRIWKEHTIAMNCVVIGGSVDAPRDDLEHVLPSPVQKTLVSEVYPRGTNLFRPRAYICLEPTYMYSDSISIRLYSQK